jgi:hypothetical protein
MPPISGQNLSNDEAARKLIPGAYEPHTVTPRPPGAMGGSAFGSTDMPAGPITMSAATIAEREKEGGGGIRERPRRTHHR